MASLSGVVVSVYPGDDAEGIPLAAGISILFDREMDETSIANGGIFLEGNDSDKLLLSTYPEDIDIGDELELLQSPGYKGLVPGTFTFKRISLTTTAEVNTTDTTGNGTLYRTKAIFTPTFPLQKATDYTTYIVADSDIDDTDKFGVRSRSVFDPVIDPSNTGNGGILASGTFTGTASDTFNVQFVQGGVVGVAKYEWWRNSAPLDIHGPILATYKKGILEDGVAIGFTDGSYDENDLFTIVVRPGETFTDTLTASFTTGNGSISAIPSSASSSVVAGLPVTTATSFQVVDTDPADFATNLSPGIAKTITVEFNSDIDPSTVTQDSVIVVAEPVTDHPSASIVSPNGPIAKSLTVSGNLLIIEL